MPDVENVLFVFTDQQRQDSLGCYGNETVRTPHVDRLADRGVRFDRAYTPTAICSPARAALVSGTHPFRNGVTRNVAGGTTLHEKYPCYPQLLRDAGYDVGLSGKWHVGAPPGEFGMDGEYIEGWFYDADHPDYEAYLEERDLPPLDAEHLTDRFPDHPDLEAGAVDDRPVEASYTSYVTERAVEMLEGYAESDGPFYQSVHFFGPHNPYYLPEEYLHMYDPEDVELPESAVKETFEGKPRAHRLQYEMSGYLDLPTGEWRRNVAAYWGWVTFIDEQLGRLLDALERLGVREETMVVFSTDHGAFLTGHKMHDKGPAMYEDIYNVPLVVDGLGESRADDRFVSLLDLPPTFLDVAGVDVPDVYDGRSLFEMDDGWRDDVVCEFHGHQFPYEQRMLRTDRYKFVVNQNDTAELYDLEADPHELDNLVGDPAHGDVAKRLHDRLYERLDERGDDGFEHLATKHSGTL